MNNNTLLVSKNEIKHLLENTNENELSKIFLQSLREAFIVTTKHMIVNLFYTIKALVDLSIITAKYLKELLSLRNPLRIKDKLLDDAKKLKDTIILRIKALKSVWDGMTFEQRKESISDFLIIVLSALVFGGGFDFEGGLPDTDLKVSAGYHRNIFSHTILIGFTFELALRFMYHLLIHLENKGIYIQNKFLKSFVEFFKTKQDKIISGIWLGLFIHFLKDANLLSARTKPYSDINGLTMNQHKAIFASNALLSAIFAIEINKNENINEH
ncbi:hypothetical protein [Fervidobacterium sp. 2310opik-2]|uniref:hypothetical protein n=1 Tax=Fervidobacterium sp. 2310opik-2 TaxID=1755815 RepID=UPI0013DF7703|nr:hypothetical protein [Fervidobacterium sp. 2310opik-2]KAF2961312.1 hypothetical protein AS161_01845 [Fervidobacterium sp. 2310opik-2]